MRYIRVFLFSSLWVCLLAIVRCSCWLDGVNQGHRSQLDEEEIEEISDLAEEDIAEAHSAADEAWH